MMTTVNLDIQTVDVPKNLKQFYLRFYDDVMFGGEDDETLIGGNGKDLILGEGGNDLLQGKGGNDRLDGGGGNDSLEGGSGDDILVGGIDIQHLACAGFFCVDGSGDDLLKGEEGNDALIGAGGNDSLLGGVGDDNLRGENGNDSLLGGDGVDRLTGGFGSDILNGGGGADTFEFSFIDPFFGLPFVVPPPRPEPGIDTIEDFNANQEDKIAISGLGEVSITQFQYDGETGALFFDDRQFAQLQPDLDFIPERDIELNFSNPTFPDFDTPLTPSVF